MCEKYTFARYQEVAMSTVVYPVVGHPVVYPIMGLCGEAGEASKRSRKPSGPVRTCPGRKS